MLQSEFYEMTKENLTPEEYAEVEAVYTEVDMKKDEFCREWLKLRKSKLMSEIQRAMLKMENLIYEKSDTISKMQTTLKEKDSQYNKRIEKIVKEHNEQKCDFAKKILFTGVSEEVYDIIEEELGIDFIIKANHETGMPLSDKEIDYMVGKL